METHNLPLSAKLKLDLMFDGLRFTETLWRAAEHAYPGFYPYRFEVGEDNPTGEPKVTIPYLLNTSDGTTVRIRGNAKSAWYVEGSLAQGYVLKNDDRGFSTAVEFESLPEWMNGSIGDVSMAQTGVSVHGDMAIINIAPGCEYFLHKENGKTTRCSFCAYGAPDERTGNLGQETEQPSLPKETYERMQQTLSAVLAETKIRHIYLVGGSMANWRSEGERFLEVARAVQETVQRRIPVTLGSGAIPADLQKQFYDEKLVDAVCFNLEIWSESLFSKVCPGKNRFVGYERWIQSLEAAVSLWGRNRVYSAMVAGIELEPEYGMTWEQAADLAIKGAEDLCSRGVIPIYSLYWPVSGRDHPDYMHNLHSFFKKLSVNYSAIRKNHELTIWEGFMCHRCAYMQLECDIDRGAAEV